MNTTTTGASMGSKALGGAEKMGVAGKVMNPIGKNVKGATKVTGKGIHPSRRAGRAGRQAWEVGSQLTGEGSATTDRAGNLSTQLTSKITDAASKAVLSRSATGGMNLVNKGVNKAQRAAAQRSAKLASKAALRDAGVGIRAAAAGARAASAMMTMVATAVSAITSFASSLPIILTVLVVVLLVMAILSFFMPSAAVTSMAASCQTLTYGVGDSDATAAGLSPGVVTVGAKTFDGKINPPLKGVMHKTSDFSPARINPVTGALRPHYGVDIAAPGGTPIYAAAAGKVIHAGFLGGCGNTVIIEHGFFQGKDYETRYCHQSMIESYVGQVVSSGQEIGRVGSTGNSTGNHLHFEIRINGKPVNPWPTIAGGTIPVTSEAAYSPEACQKFGGGGALPPDTLPVSASYPPQSASVKDPTSSGMITPRMNTLYQAVNAMPNRAGVKSIGCWRPKDSYPDHPSGHACDFMYAYGTFPAGKALADGNALATWFTQHANEYGIRYLIWQGRMWVASSGTWKPYTSSVYKDVKTNPTTGHYDHIHVTVW